MTKQRVSEAVFSESEYVADMEVSTTMAVLIEAERLKAQGIEIVDLGAGEPDFPTPATSKTLPKRQ